MPALIQQLARFTIVGLAAMTTHLLVTILLVRHTGSPPLVANLIAFGIAFQISYNGHARWTFNPQVEPRSSSQASTPPPHSRKTRFLGVALAGLVLNESLFAWLLHATPLPYETALACVLILVAGFTFLISKCWAFRLKPSNFH